ncbi:hypothetical protein RvY_07467 [Ramazzottius varieornatus]|uniref:AB hydrolase-1 domain-containing protein n=1 Tax=Ramazzottius varieornatus TaxID=947166 RepID=A0A1D1V2I1_RAMVA|nr:hypothetical protein RvY_07467 [Ramazzottius varieornatus]
MPQMRIRLPVNLKNPDAPAPTYPRGAILMVAGAGGGFTGPAGMYPELSEAISAYPNLIAVQTGYRYPGELKPCVEDTINTLNMLRKEYNVERAVLVGWSFGGAVVISAAAAHPVVKGIATIASQTAGTNDVGKLAGQGEIYNYIRLEGPQ